MVNALTAADIEHPICISVQWDERSADAITGEDLNYSISQDGRIELVMPSLHIHRAVVVQAGS